MSIVLHGAKPVRWKIVNNQTEQEETNILAQLILNTQITNKHNKSCSKGNYTVMEKKTVNAHVVDENSENTKLSIVGGLWVIYTFEIHNIHMCVHNN